MPKSKHRHHKGKKPMQSPRNIPSAAPSRLGPLTPATPTAPPMVTITQHISERIDVVTGRVMTAIGYVAGVADAIEGQRPSGDAAIAPNTAGEKLSTGNLIDLLSRLEYMVNLLTNEIGRLDPNINN